MVESWFSRPSAEMVRELMGQAVSVWVDAEIPRDGASLPDFLRFALVLKVKRRFLLGRNVCPRCGDHGPRYTLHVVWEAGYSEVSNHICDSCLAGRVVKGGDSLQFGPRPSGQQCELRITMVYTREDVMRPAEANPNEVHHK